MFDWITGFLEATGLIGIALLMFAENVFPPIPSELIMPLAGFNAAQGVGSLIGAIIAGTVGSVAGLSVWYWIAVRFGLRRLKILSDRMGRFFMMDAEDIDNACRWFDRHGVSAVMFGRLLPTIRTLISVPAGLASMPFWVFLAFSAAGTFLWTGFLTITGYLLESQYSRVEAWINPLSTFVVVGVIILYIWGVATYPGRHQKRDKGRSDR